MGKRAGVVSVDVEPNLSQVGSRLDSFARTLKPLGLNVDLKNDFAKDVERGALSSRRSLDGISTTRAQGELRQLGTVGERELNRVGSSAKLSSGALLTVGAGSVVAGTKIIGALKPAKDAASDLNEVVGYSQQVFGQSADAIATFGDGAAKALGQSKREAIEGANTFATFGKAAGLAGDDLVGFSTGLLTLASDLASAKNTKPEEAITAIGAALRGESEPIRNYGVLLDDATLRQEAFALGLTKTTKDALTPQQKVLAAQSAIFKQTADAQGDFARTADGAANSQRIAAAEFENTKAKLGEGLLPVVSAFNKTLSTTLDVLDKIPGGTTAAGVGLAGLGAAAVLGGGVTSIVGGVKAIREFRADLGGAAADAVDLADNLDDAADAAVRNSKVGKGPTGQPPIVDGFYSITNRAPVTAAATETVATAMDDVAISSLAAGEAGTVAMGSIAAGATAAALTVGGVTSSIATTSFTRIGSDLEGVAFQTARVREGVTGIGGAINELPSGRGSFIDADSWEVPGELGPGPARNIADVSSSLATAEPTASRFAGTAARLGSSIKGVGTSALGLVGSISPATAGLGALTIGAIGLSVGLGKANEQTERGIDLLTKLADTRSIQAAFDPGDPSRFKETADEIGRILSEDVYVDPQNWMDKLADKVGAYDLSIFGDSQLSANQEAAAEALIEKLQVSIDSLDPTAARQLLDEVGSVMRGLGDSAEEVDSKLGPLYQQLDDAAAAGRASGSFKELDTTLKRLGVTVDAEASKWDNYATVLGGIFDPGQNAIAAAEALADGQEAVIEARKKLTLIESGTSDALTSAREALVDADKDLTKAVEDNADQQEDAFRRIADAQDRLAEAREKGGAMGSGGIAAPDTRIDLSIARDIAAAQRDVTEAEQEFNKIASGESDQVVSAKERVADAQRKVNEELANTGPNSDAAREAAEALSDAEMAIPGLYVANQQAAAKFKEQIDEHPEAVAETVKEIDRAVAAGLISVAVADAWKEKLWETLVPATKIADTLAGIGPVITNPTSADAAERRAGSGSTPPARPIDLGSAETISEKDGLRLGLGDAPGDYVGNTRDINGKSWRWDSKKNRWERIEGRLFGGNVQAFGMYEVVEDGRPELLNVGNKSFLMTGAQGGDVTPFTGLEARSFGQGTPGAGPAPTTGAQGAQLLTEETGQQILAALIASVNSRPNVTTGDINLTSLDPAKDFTTVLRESEDATYSGAGR